jgi:hypothetical protein
MAHVINLSAKLLYVQPEASRALVNVGVNDQTSEFAIQASDMACAQCSKYSAALIVAKLSFVNQLEAKLFNSSINACLCVFAAIVGHDIALIFALTVLICVAKSVEVKCPGITGTASVQTQYVKLTVDHAGAPETIDLLVV